MTGSFRIQKPLDTSLHGYADFFFHFFHFFILFTHKFENMSAFTNLGDRVIDNDGNLVASRNPDDWSDTFLGKRWFSIRLEERNGKRYYVTGGSYLGFVEDMFWEVAVIKRNLDIYMELGVWNQDTFSHVIDLFTLLERGWAFANEYVLDHLYDVADFEFASGVLSIEEFFYQVGMGVINYGQGEMAGKLEREILSEEGFGDPQFIRVRDESINDDDVTESTFWNASGLSFGTMSDDEFIPSEVIVNIMESWQPDPDEDITVSDTSGHEVIDLTSIDDVIDLTMED